jgi:hypothetical protein
MSKMTWKTKTVGFAMSLAVFASLALASGADSWLLGLIFYTGKH